MVKVNTGAETVNAESLLRACKDRADPTGRLVDHLLTLDRPYYVATNTTPMTLTRIQGDLSAQMTHREIGRLDHVLDTAVGEERTGPCISCEEKDVIDTGASRRLPCFVVYLVPSVRLSVSRIYTKIDLFGSYGMCRHRHTQLHYQSRQRMSRCVLSSQFSSATSR